MSEANTPSTGFDTASAAAGTAGATLYPDGGGQGGAASEPVVPAGEQGVPGSDTQDAPAGTDTTAGSAGTDSVSAPSGGDSVEGSEGSDTVEGSEGPDSLTSASYKDKITLPEGIVADDALMGETTTLFAELGVAPDKAQGLIDLFGKVLKANTDKATADYQTQQTSWVNEINSMPEFQGEARATSLQAIGKVFDEFGSPEARAVLDSSGVGNSPALAKMFHKIAVALSEGTPTTQGRPAPNGADGKRADNTGRGKTIGQRLYPNQSGQTQ